MSELQQQPRIPGFGTASRAVWEKSDAGQQMALALPAEAEAAPAAQGRLPLRDAEWEAWSEATDALGLSDDGPDGEWYEAWDHHVNA